jgi:hypothetical protein
LRLRLSALQLVSSGRKRTATVLTGFELPGD